MLPLLRILVLAPLAYVAACIAAGYLVAFALFGLTDESMRTGLVIWSGIPLSIYAGIMSFIPALLAIVLAEMFGWRSIFYWLGVGGGIGLIGSGVTGFAGKAVDPELWNDYGLALHLAAGFVGGLVYWLIAGQAAGTGWSGAPDEPSPTLPDAEGRPPPPAER